jgi:hypothetical protein
MVSEIEKRYEVSLADFAPSPEANAPVGPSRLLSPRFYGPALRVRGTQDLLAATAYRLLSAFTKTKEMPSGQRVEGAAPVGGQVAGSQGQAPGPRGDRRGDVPPGVAGLPQPEAQVAVLTAERDALKEDRAKTLASLRAVQAKLENQVMKCCRSRCSRREGHRNGSDPTGSRVAEA